MKQEKTSQGTQSMLFEIGELSGMQEGFSVTPPRNPWGINFGGGLNSTAVILECIERQLRPDWILFADTGSEMPGTLEHVDVMRDLIKKSTADWPELITVRWMRKKEPIGFEPLHEWCLRTETLPSKAYGLAGCTSKWKIYPMDRWRKIHGFDKGAFAVGYDAGEHGRITTACKRGDMPDFTAWYPLVAWNKNRDDCQDTVNRWGVKVGKSSCFMCPNMRVNEWVDLKNDHPELFGTALQINDTAAANNHHGMGGLGLFRGKLNQINNEIADRGSDDLQNEALEDRCHHGGCFT